MGCCSPRLFETRCFELLGIDVMLDAKMKPYLIEAGPAALQLCLCNELGEFDFR